MCQTEFEKQLSKRILRRRLIEGAIAILFLALSIVCYRLREASKEVIVHEGFIFIPGWEEVNYNDVYVPFIVIGLIGAIMVGAFLLSDFIFCGFRSIEKDGQYLTVYRGMNHNIVYVDGKEENRIGPFSYVNVAEVWLENRVKVTVSFSRAFWYIAHISFSDNTPSVEL